MPSFNYDLNALPAAVMIYDRNEHRWPESQRCPVLSGHHPWLKAGTPLEELAERFIDAVYNVDPAFVKRCVNPSFATVGRINIVKSDRPVNDAFCSTSAACGRHYRQSA